jgi:hypothetical protein
MFQRIKFLQNVKGRVNIIRACELNKSHIISTDEDPGLRIENFAVINVVFPQTKLLHANIQRTYIHIILLNSGQHNDSLYNMLSSHRGIYKRLNALGVIIPDRALLAIPSDIYLNQGVIIPFDSTYDSTIGNTSTPQIHSMCIPHRRTPTTAVFI